MGHKFRLSGMMFLQFFVWGAWYATVANYMIEIDMTKYIYWAFTVGPIGAIISPFFVGMIADRFFATERVLGILHIVGGIFMLMAPFFEKNAVLFILFLGLHMLCYQPTLALTNTLSFHNIKDPEKEFPAIRMFGTIGWIIAGVLVSRILQADKTALPLLIGGGAGILMGLYSFTLPHTPAPAAGTKTTFREIAGVDALKKLSSPSFNLFIIASLLICIPLSAYYAYAQTFVGATGFQNPAFTLTFGQMSEAVLILLLPWFFRRVGVKWTLVFGMAGWVLRYGLFSAAAPQSVQWMVFIGILLHGVCYDFFYVTGQLYVEKKAPLEIRGQAQGFIVLITYGIGMLIGAQISGWLFNGIVDAQASLAVQLQQYQEFWLYPAIFALAVLIIFAVFFREQKDVLKAAAVEDRGKDATGTIRASAVEDRGKD